MWKILNSQPIDFSGCPVCGGVVDGEHPFLPFGNPVRLRAICPYCGSLERHRLYALYFNLETDLFERPQRILHFAPESGLSKVLSRPDLHHDYYPVDLDPDFPGIRMAADITNIPDEALALQEMMRVLKPEGTAYINTVVYKIPETLENAAYNTQELREKYYGQSDHVRKYGQDYVDHLRSVFPHVEQINYTANFDAQERMLLGLQEPDSPYAEIYCCRKKTAEEYRHSMRQDISSGWLMIGTSVREGDGAAQEEVRKIRASLSYRLGRTITFIPRKVCGGVRCIQEHGISYTAARLLDQLHVPVKADESVKRREVLTLKKKLSPRKMRGKQQDMMFLSPPCWDCYSPFSAVPCLVGKLRQEGFVVEQYDIGIYYIHYLLSKKWRDIADWCLSQTFYEQEIEIYQRNCYSSYFEFKNDMWFLHGGKFDIDAVKLAYEEMNAVQRRVLDAFYSGIYSAAVTDIDFDSCSSIVRCVDEWDTRGLLEALCEADINIFQNIPEVVGISITSTCQFIPGCAIAALVREFRPDVKIIFGGSCADLFANSTYARKADIRKYFDYIIIGEGETALTKLLRYLKEGGTLDDIPNLMLIGSDGEIRFTNQMIENVNTLPPPDFDGLNLDLYLSPKLILPYQASRGCHYGQCAFCNHDEKYRHHYRSKPAEMVVADILRLCRKYRAQHIQFVDEAIRPDCFRDIVKEMDGHEEFSHIKWFYYSRVSRKYDVELLRKAHKNGCEMVMFGIESFNQRLLNFIKKGTNVETARYCLELFHMCGIKTYAWLLCNLPSETVEEAELDLSEVRKMSGSIDAFSVGMFMLMRNTEMYNNLEEYNIIRMDAHDPTKFQSHKDGTIVDGIRMRKFFEQEYLRYQKERFSLGNRYTLFFE